MKITNIIIQTDELENPISIEADSMKPEVAQGILEFFGPILNEAQSKLLETYNSLVIENFRLISRIENLSNGLQRESVDIQRRDIELKEKEFDFRLKRHAELLNIEQQKLTALYVISDSIEEK